MESFKNEIKKYCKEISYNLKSYANGEFYKCPNCCEIIKNSENKNCPNCEEKLNSNNQLSLYDYFENALDIEYKIGSDKSYRSVCVMITCGGPNVYIDTKDAKIKLYWGGDYEECYIERQICNKIDAIFEEMYTY